MPLRPSTAFASTFLELSASPFDVAIAFSNYCRTLPQEILQQTCTLTGRKRPYEGYRSVSVLFGSSIRLSAGAQNYEKYFGKVLLQVQSGFQPEPEQAVRLRKEAKCAFFFVCLPFADDKACVCVVVSPALRSLRRCQAIARRRDLSDQHQPIASLEATNRECGRNPRCQLLLEASSQLFSSGRHPGSHQL